MFDRAPDGERPGRRLALVVRLAPPLWAWLDDAGRDGGRDFAYRPPEDTQITGAAALPLDRGFTLDAIAPGERPFRLHVELWAPGNLIVEETGRRIVWCARVRAASTRRGAIAPDAPYPPPPPTSIVDPTSLDHATLESILYGLPADERLVALAKRCAGLPKGALEALAPGLPPALFDEARVPDEAMAAALRAWAEQTYAPGATSISGLAWSAPSPGAHLIAVAPCAEPHASWNEAARSVGRGLPEPVDADALALAKGRVKKLERTVAALMDDIAGAAEAADVRARARALVAFLPRVTRGAASVSLPDPADPSRTFDDRARSEAASARERRSPVHPRRQARARRRARARADRGGARRAVAAKAVVAAIERGEAGPAAPPRREARAGGTRGATPERKSAGKGRPAVPSALEPRRYKTSEGWEVWIGKNNQGNDHLTHRLARPEDIWMHVHGAAGSHVVLRRGKGPNEPSKATLAEVAGLGRVLLAGAQRRHRAGDRDREEIRAQAAQGPRRTRRGDALEDRVRAPDRAAGCGAAQRRGLTGTPRSVLRRTPAQANRPIHLAWER